MSCGGTESGVNVRTCRIELVVSKSSDDRRADVDCVSLGPVNWAGGEIPNRHGLLAVESYEIEVTG